MTASTLKQDPKTKRFKWMLIYFKHTQYANFSGKSPMLPQNYTTDKWSETMKNETKRLPLFWFSFYSLFSAWKNFKYIFKLLTGTKSTVHHKNFFIIIPVHSFFCLFILSSCLFWNLFFGLDKNVVDSFKPEQQPDCITTYIIGDIIRNNDGLLDKNLVATQLRYN